MAAAQQEPPQELLESLGLPAHVQLEPVYTGASQIWRVDRDNRAYALRLWAATHSELLREMEAMKAARSAGLPVPALYQHDHADGHGAMLMDWAQGERVSAVLRKRPRWAGSIGGALGRLQAHLHAVPAPMIVRRYGSDWIGLAGQDEQALQAKLHTPMLRSNRLLHLDLHPNNVLALPDGQISALLDWTNARVGDPRADFARTYTLLRVEPWAPVESLPLRYFRWRFFQGWARGYMQSAEPQPDMPLFFAWAGAFMLRELAPRAADPHHWLTPAHLQRVRLWTERWKQAAGV